MSESVGEQLKRARLSTNLTLDQVSQSLHIRTRYLEALENNERSVLPSEVQGRGFLRLYADFLNLPIQSLLDIWAGHSPSQVNEDDTNQYNKNTEYHTVDLSMQDFSLWNKDQSPPSSIQSLPTQNVLSQSIFIEIGQKLQQQRKALGLSLDEIERYTHVKKHYLSAIENGRLDLLPSTVQGRGMISNYAYFLEMDSEKILLRFAEGLQIKRTEQLLTGNKPSSKSRHIFRKASPLKKLITADLIIGSILIISLMFFAIWGLIHVSSDQNQINPTSLSISEVLLRTDQIPTESSVTEIPQLTSTQQSIDNTNYENQGEDVETSTTGIPILDNLPLQVYVVAYQRAWMRVTIDGKISFEGRVIPGNAYSYSGSKHIELLTGNGSALQVFFNQTNFGILGNVGQVSDYIFSIEGVVTPTSIFTPTSTQTPQPTITLMPSPTVSTPTVTPFIP